MQEEIDIDEIIDAALFDIKFTKCNKITVNKDQISDLLINLLQKWYSKIALEDDPALFGSFRDAV